MSSPIRPWNSAESASKRIKINNDQPQMEPPPVEALAVVMKHLSLQSYGRIVCTSKAYQESSEAYLLETVNALGLNALNRAELKQKVKELRECMLNEQLPHSQLAFEERLSHYTHSYSNISEVLNCSALYEAKSSPLVEYLSGNRIWERLRKTDDANVDRNLLTKSLHTLFEKTVKKYKLPLTEAETRIRTFLANAEADASFQTLAMERARPLHDSIFHKKIEWLQFFIEQGVNMESVNDNELRPLHYAVQKGQLEFARCLLAAGAEVNALTNNDPNEIKMNTTGRSALSIACTKSRTSPSANTPAMVRLLLEKGAATVVAEQPNNQNPLYLAQSNGLVEIAAILQEHMA